MMGILAIMDNHMQRNPGFQGQLPQEFMYQLRREAAYGLGRVLGPVFKVGTVADVDDHLG
ncbi:hypothetical protein D3C86_2202260 [compost metagenome]